MTEENRWLTVGEAARALGVSREAVRRRIGRGTLEARTETRGNRQRLLVQLPEPLPELVAPTIGQRLPRDADQFTALLAERDARVAQLEADSASLRAQVARLEERGAAAEELKAELRRELSEVKADRDRLFAMLETALADHRAHHRPWPGLRAWWRRLIEGEG